MDEVIDPIYLPFPERQLRRHFLSDPDGHTLPFLKSAQRYHEFLKAHPKRAGIPVGQARHSCQIEKDERFWTATALMRLYHCESPRDNFARLLSMGFGSVPPLEGMASWDDCLAGEVHLFLEATLSSPSTYKNWLQQHLSQQQFIPYVVEAAAAGRALEGPTHVDALLLNETNGFAVMFEAKALSDISCQVTFDVRRNQIARNVDVMLEMNTGLELPLSRRDPYKTLFSLLTPEVFRTNPHSRLYGWLFHDYRDHPRSLARDLPHRQQEDWPGIARRLGWLTWEDCRAVLPEACPWLGAQG